MEHLPRWFMAMVLVLAVLGLLLWARGPDHHHGDDEGAIEAPYVASALAVGALVA